MLLPSPFCCDYKVFRAWGVWSRWCFLCLEGLWVLLNVKMCWLSIVPDIIITCIPWFWRTLVVGTGDCELPSKTQPEFWDKRPGAYGKGLRLWADAINSGVTHILQTLAFPEIPDIYQVILKLKWTYHLSLLHSREDLPGLSMIKVLQTLPPLYWRKKQHIQTLAPTVLSGNRICFHFFTHPKHIQ